LLHCRFPNKFQASPLEINNQEIRRTEYPEHWRKYRPVVSRCATRSISRLLSGRYPGLQVLIRRLPMITHSGILANPHSLTVAGAAQAWRTDVLAPASRLTCLLADGHLKAARTLPQICRALIT
jgi:hypothetical protein